MQRCYRVLGPFLAALALSASAPAQQKSAPLQVVTRLVVLDVEVTDAAGKPVEDLTRDDLQVFEDGKLQTLRSFEPPATHTLPVTSGSADATLDPARPAAFGQSPVTILVLDQLNTHFADSSFARRQMHDYLAAQPAVLPVPATLLALHERGFAPLHGFTRNRGQLLAALAAAPTKYAWTLEVNGKTDHGPLERLQASLNALESMAQSYAPIPGRKNVVWVGGGFPSVDPAQLSTDDAKLVEDTIRHVTDVMLDKRLTLYAVDPTSSAAGMTEITDPMQMAFALAAGEGMAVNSDTFDIGADFDKLGPMTGGRIVRGRNDLTQQIAAAVTLGTHFYTLSYTPTSSSQAAVKFRNIRVVSRRAGLVASTRVGYYPQQAEPQSSTEAITADLGSAVESALPLNGLRVTVTAAGPGEWVVHVGSGGLYWTTNPDGSWAAHVSVLAAAFSGNSAMKEHTLHSMTAMAKPGANPSAADELADFAIALKPSPAASRLRFIVRGLEDRQYGLSRHHAISPVATSPGETAVPETLLLETHNRVALIRLNRPAALNALNRQMMLELTSLLASLDHDSGIGCIVLTGSEKAFAAGADIKEMQGLSFSGAFAENWLAGWEDISRIRKPLLAAVAGYALGGGCELAMVCDFILAADTAKFGQPEIKLGLLPGIGGSQRLTRAVGKAKAMEMCLTGRTMDAVEAERSGLVARVLPAAELMAAAMAAAETIAAMSLPAAMMVKEAIQRSAELPLSEGLRYERRLFHAAFATQDSAEGIAAFIEKRPPRFTHT